MERGGLHIERTASDAEDVSRRGGVGGIYEDFPGVLTSRFSGYIKENKLVFLQIVKQPYARNRGSGPSFQWSQTSQALSPCRRPDKTQKNITWNIPRWYPFINLTEQTCSALLSGVRQVQNLSVHHISSRGTRAIISNICKHLVQGLEAEDASIHAVVGRSVIVSVCGLLQRGREMGPLGIDLLTSLISRTYLVIRPDAWEWFGEALSQRLPSLSLTLVLWVTYT